jgi:hypothetical protein
MAFAPAGGEAALGAWTIVAAFGFIVCFGLLQAWRNTVGGVFDAMSKVKINIKWAPDIHPFRFLGDINNTVEHSLSTWAALCEKQMGLALHYMAELYHVTANEVASLSENTLALGHHIIHHSIPDAIRTEVAYFLRRQHSTDAAVASTSAELAQLKKRTSAAQRTQTQTNTATHAQATTTTHDLAHTKAKVQEVAQSVRPQTAVITQVVDVGSLPVPFGRTISQLKKRISRAEAWTAAGALSIAMANVLGLPNPRCLRDGPIGRVSRRLCGMPSNFLNDILGLLADFFILENICTVLPWVETAASEIGAPLVEVLTEVGAGLCHGAHAPGALRGPRASVPDLIFGVGAQGV